MLVQFTNSQRPAKRRGVVVSSSPSGAVLRAAPGGRIRGDWPGGQAARMRFAAQARGFAAADQATRDAWQAAAEAATITNARQEAWQGNGAALAIRTGQARRLVGEGLAASPGDAGQDGPAVLPLDLAWLGGNTLSMPVLLSAWPIAWRFSVGQGAPQNRDNLAPDPHTRWTGTFDVAASESTQSGTVLMTARWPLAASLVMVVRITTADANNATRYQGPAPFEL